MNTHVIRAWPIVAASLLFLGCPPYKGSYDHRDTNGRARGVASQGIHAYVADGSRGLKIFNISNADNVQQVSTLDLPGFVSRVEVRGDIAVVADSEQKQIHVVNVANVHAPQLAWTYKTLDKPIALDLTDGVVYVAERGDDPQARTYFSGLQAISCSLSKVPAQASSLAVADIADVRAMSPDRLVVVGGRTLSVLTKTPAGAINGTPLSRHLFAANEALQSVDGRASYVLVLGKRLYVVNLSHPQAPTVVDSKPIPGHADGRVISASEVAWRYLPLGQTGLPAPFLEYIPFCYTTLREYGAGWVDPKKLTISNLTQQIDVYGESNGHAKLYDVKMIHSGGMIRKLPDARGDRTIAVLGALDNYGLAYNVLEEISATEYLGAP